MRAVQVREVGGPEVLRLRELPDPEPGTGQVAVDVEAAGVNFIDVYHRTGAYPLPLPFVAGSEGAGTVSAVGPEVAGVAVGDRVAWAMLPGTGYTEKAVLAADRTVPLPNGTTAQDAAALLFQGLTVQYLTSSTYPVGKGDVVVVHAAAGGIGQLLTQVATARGATVVGTTSTQAKAETARRRGADRVVVGYGAAELSRAVDEVSGGAGADVVYDGVGAATFEAGLECLRRRGTMVLFGAASGAPAPLDPALLGKKGSLFLTRPTLADHLGDREELLERAADVLGWAARGEVSVEVGARYPLGEAGRAHADLESRRTTGKLLLLP